MYSRLYMNGRYRMGPVHSWCIFAHSCTLCCTCGVDCERSCNVDVVPVADICDTGGCRRRCTLCCSIMPMVAAVVWQPTHWRMKQNQSMTLQNCDAKYVSRDSAYTSTGGGSTEKIDGWQVRIPYIAPWHIYEARTSMTVMQPTNRDV